MKKTSTFILKARPAPKLLSLVIPMFNEEKVIPFLKDELSAFFKTTTCAIEIIFVNDGSSDNTITQLSSWAQKDPRIKVLNFSRNFGHQIAATAGLDYAKGDAVVLLDADLQDPLSVIHQMIEKYQEGYDVVYGQRTLRHGETFFKKTTAWIFYRVMRKLIHPELPVDTGDFRLMSRECLETLKKLRELHRFLRGMVTWVGFPQTAVQYVRASRIAGETKYPLQKMIRFAWTAAISFSALPLRLSLSVGFCVALFGFCMGVYAVTRYFIFTFLHPTGYTYNPGWATLVTLICVIGGAILMSIGILGDYLGRVFEETKHRPLYIVHTTENIDK